MPWIANHWLFVTFVNLTILFSELVLIISSRNIKIDKSKLFGTFAPPVRLELVLLYLMTFFHKLNLDWLDPHVSRGTEMYLLMTNGLGFFQSPVFSHYAAIYGTLTTELMIPLFFIIKRLRLAGIMAALIFHYVLGADEFYNFSAATFALLFLFTPDDFHDCIHKWWNPSRIAGTYRRVAAERSFKKAKITVLAIIGATAAAIFIYSQLTAELYGHFIEIREPGSIGKTRLYYAFLGLWWLYGLSIITLLLFTIKKGKAPSNERPYFIPKYKILMIYPLLVIINGLSPYLGLKTQTSWSMFSNLRTENGSSNHLIIRHPYYLADYQNDLVKIVHSSDPHLNAFREKGYLIPYFELHCYLSRKADNNVELDFVRNGSFESISTPADYPEPFTPVSFLSR
ncbi:MAG: hypothetical protein ACHQ6U_05960 [Thermodesulfobacteriota bacterium]